MIFLIILIIASVLFLFFKKLKLNIKLNPGWEQLYKANFPSKIAQRLKLCSHIKSDDLFTSKSRVISIRVSSEDYEDLLFISKSRGMSISEYLRDTFMIHNISRQEITPIFKAPIFKGKMRNGMDDKNLIEKLQRIKKIKRGVKGIKIRKNSPERYYWDERAFIEGAINIKELGKTPSPYMRSKYPEYIKKM